ncbi:MAG: hypothetical protein ACXVNF_06860, partial [Neobacillus sp.]
MKKHLNIIMVSDVPPDPSYTAGQVLDKITENTPFANFHLYWLNQSNLPEPIKLNAQTELVKKLTFESGGLTTKIKDRFIRIFSLYPKIQNKIKIFFSFISAVIVGFKLGLQIRKTPANFVWLVLQGEKLAITYYIITWFSGKKIILHQWDPIEWWMEHKGHSQLLIKLIDQVIHRIEKKALINLVPSESWQNLQKSKGFSSVRIDNFFLNQDIIRCSHERLGNETEVNAVFLGQLYSNHELQKLIEILKSSASDMGKNLIIHYFGAANAQISEPDVKLINHGFLSRKDLIANICKWDLALLPYPMEERFDAASKYSFPSKSRVYLAASLPILAYCKFDSSPEVFFSKN